MTQTAATQKDERFYLVLRNADTGKPERWGLMLRQSPPVRDGPPNTAMPPGHLADPDNSNGNKAQPPHLDERAPLVLRYDKTGRPESWNAIVRQPPPAPDDLSDLATLPKRLVALGDSRSYKAVQEHLQAAARAHRVDYALLKAVAAVESGFNANLISSHGAVGLMQIKPSTARAYSVHATAAKLTDPRINIDAGARHLARLIKLFNGHLDLAVAAYNAGENAVLRAGNKVPDYPQTRRYVRKVMGLYAVFKSAPPGRS